MSERERLEFIERRDGMAAALEFAARAKAQYVAAVRDPSRYGMYKNRFRKAAVELTRWLREQGP